MDFCFTVLFDFDLWCWFVSCVRCLFVRCCSSRFGVIGMLWICVWSTCMCNVCGLRSSVIWSVLRLCLLFVGLGIKLDFCDLSRH